MSLDIEFENENDNQVNRHHPGGRPPNPVWEHFEKKAISTAGHFSAKCNYCGVFMARGRPNELQIHLSKNCHKCPNEIQLKYLRMIVDTEDQDAETAESSNKRRKTAEQTTLDDHWDDATEIPKYRQKIIDQAWLKAFVSCGIPFSIIENPFFIDAVKSLRSSYNPPSRNRLSGNLLNREVIKIDSKINNALKNFNNLTLGMKIFKNFIIFYY